MVKTYEEYYHDVKTNGDNLQFVPEEMKNYILCLIAIEKNPEALAYVPRTLNKNEYLSLCRKAACGRVVKHYCCGGSHPVSSDSYSGLNHVPLELRTFDLCLEAVKSCGKEAFKSVPDEFKTGEMYLALLQTSDYFNLEDVPENLRNREICLESIKKNRYNLEHVPVQLRDREICLEAVKKNGYNLEYVPEEHKDEEMCLTAVRNTSHNVYDFFPEKYRTWRYCLYAIFRFDCLIKTKND